MFRFCLGRFQLGSCKEKKLAVLYLKLVSLCNCVTRGVVGACSPDEMKKNPLVTQPSASCQTVKSTLLHSFKDRLLMSFPFHSLSFVAFISLFFCPHSSLLPSFSCSY